MDNLSVADINSHMTGVAYHIAGLCIFQTIDRCTHASVRRRGMRQAYAKVLVYAHNESGTVGAVSETGSAIYIGITHKL